MNLSGRSNARGARETAGRVPLSRDAKISERGFLATRDSVRWKVKGNNKKE